MLSDAVIATQANDGLKHCITSCAKAASEAANSALRAAFAQISQDGIRRQGELAKLMEQKGWYTAPALNPAHIQQIMPQIQSLIQGGTTNNPSYGIYHSEQRSSGTQHFDQGFFGAPYTGSYSQQPQQPPQLYP